MPRKRLLRTEKKSILTSNDLHNLVTAKTYLDVERINSINEVHDARLLYHIPYVFLGHEGEKPKKKLILRLSLKKEVSPPTPKLKKLKLKLGGERVERIPNSSDEDDFEGNQESSQKTSLRIKLKSTDKFVENTPRRPDVGDFESMEESSQKRKRRVKSKGGDTSVENTSGRCDVGDFESKEESPQKRKRRVKSKGGDTSVENTSGRSDEGGFESKEESSQKRSRRVKSKSGDESVESTLGRSDEGDFESKEEISQKTRRRVKLKSGDKSVENTSGRSDECDFQSRDVSSLKRSRRVKLKSGDKSVENTSASSYDGLVSNFATEDNVKKKEEEKTEDKIGEKDELSKKPARKSFTPTTRRSERQASKIVEISSDEYDEVQEPPKRLSVENTSTKTPDKDVNMKNSFTKEVIVKVPQMKLSDLRKANNVNKEASETDNGDHVLVRRSSRRPSIGPNTEQNLDESAPKPPEPNLDTTARRIRGQPRKIIEEEPETPENPKTEKYENDKESTPVTGKKKKTEEEETSSDDDNTPSLRKRMKRKLTTSATPRPKRKKVDECDDSSEDDVDSDEDNSDSDDENMDTPEDLLKAPIIVFNDSQDSLKLKNILKHRDDNEAYSPGLCSKRVRFDCTTVFTDNPDETPKSTSITSPSSSGEAGEEEQKQKIERRGRKKIKRPITPIRIRVSKKFEFEQYISPLCEAVANRKETLKKHLKDVKVNVFRYVLPDCYDTTKGNVEKYLNKRKMLSADIGFSTNELKTLVEKYSPGLVSTIIETAEDCDKEEVATSKNSEKSESEVTGAIRDNVNVAIDNDGETEVGDKDKNENQINSDEDIAESIEDTEPNMQSQISLDDSSEIIGPVEDSDINSPQSAESILEPIAKDVPNPESERSANTTSPLEQVVGSASELIPSDEPTLQPIDSIPSKSSLSPVKNDGKVSTVEEVQSVKDQSTDEISESRAETDENTKTSANELIANDTVHLTGEGEAISESRAENDVEEVPAKDKSQDCGEQLGSEESVSVDECLVLSDECDNGDILNIRVNEKDKSIDSTSGNNDENENNRFPEKCSDKDAHSKSVESNNSGNHSEELTDKEEELNLVVEESDDDQAEQISNELSEDDKQDKCQTPEEKNSSNADADINTESSDRGKSVNDSDIMEEADSESEALELNKDSECEVAESLNGNKADNDSDKSVVISSPSDDYHSADDASDVSVNNGGKERSVMTNEQLFQLLYSDDESKDEESTGKRKRKETDSMDCASAKRVKLSEESSIKETVNT